MDSFGEIKEKVASTATDLVHRVDEFNSTGSRLRKGFLLIAGLLGTHALGRAIFHSEDAFVRGNLPQNQDDVFSFWVVSTFFLTLSILIQRAERNQIEQKK